MKKEKPKTAVLFARLEEAEARTIQKICAAQDETPSHIMRKLLRLWLKSGNALFEK